MRLASYVHVHDDEGRTHQFGPDDTVPDWAAAKITNPRAWETPPAPEPQLGDFTVDEDQVPDGSANDVLAWVASDPGRAQTAYDAEVLRDPSRKGLLADLDKLRGATTPQ